MHKKGNVFENNGHNGWIYGAFMDGIAKDSRAEIKIVKLPKSFTSKPHFQKTATKIDIVWEGNGIWQIDDQDVQLSRGDYVIIPPETTACIKQVLSDDIIVQTIKIPSIPEDKVVV
jgi:quercetin dioxygenase-like cupin family protein